MRKRAVYRKKPKLVPRPLYQIVYNPSGAFEKDGKRLDIIPRNGAQKGVVLNKAREEGVILGLGRSQVIKWSYMSKRGGIRLFDLKEQ